MPKKILISGGWGYGNLGDNAILAGFLSSIPDVLASHDCRILSFSVEEVERNHGLVASTSIHRLMEDQRKLPNWAIRRLPFIRTSYATITRIASEQLREIEKADLLVLCGGGYFNGSWTSMRDAQYAMIRKAKESGTKTIIIGQSIGPFSKAETAGRLADHLRMVDLIAVRDQVSYEICQDALGNSKNLSLTADLANLLPFDQKMKSPATSHATQRLGVMVQYPRAKNSKNSTRTRTKRLSQQDYFHRVGESISRFAQGKAIEINVIPSTIWDRQACKEVTAFLVEQGCNAVYQEPRDAKDFVSLCQSVDLMFSTNMHPLIIAATAGVPSVALSYHFKTDHFMSEIGLGDSVLDIDRFTTADIPDLLERTWLNREALSEMVTERQAHLRSLASTNVKALRQFLES